MAHASQRAIVAALLANAGIALAKGVAWALTGSPSMLAETLHSVADTGNQALLLLGARRAARPADEAHPFGYGQEAYFWAFVVAICMFSLGGGAALWEGFTALRRHHPAAGGDVRVAMGVLLVSIAFESGSWWAALRAVRAERAAAGPGLVERLLRSRDVALVIVFLEDTAAMAGLVVALAGIGVAHWTGVPGWDAAGSLVIGALLVAVALVVGARARHFLIGAAASPELVAAVERVVAAHAAVARVERVATLQLGPHDVLVTVELALHPHASAGEVLGAIEDVDAAVHGVSADIRDVFVEAHRFPSPTLQSA